jgi:hypothetical protein
MYVAIGSIYTWQVNLSLPDNWIYPYLTIESIPRESLPADAVIGAVGVLALGKGVAVEDVEGTLVVVWAALLGVPLHRVAVVAQAAEGAKHILTLSAFAHLSWGKEIFNYGYKLDQLDTLKVESKICCTWEEHLK